MSQRVIKLSDNAASRIKEIMSNVGNLSSKNPNKTERCGCGESFKV